MRSEEFTSNIFTKSTGMPMYDDMLKDPEYFAQAKSKVFKIIQMSPDRYIAYCHEGFNSGTFYPEEQLVDKYARQVKAGSPMPMPVLMYELTEDGTNFSQEGRHRAYVAQKLDVSIMPVMVVASAWPAHQFREQFAEFAANIWDKF